MNQLSELVVIIHEGDCHVIHVSDEMVGSFGVVVVSRVLSTRRYLAFKRRPTSCGYPSKSIKCCLYYRRGSLVVFMSLTRDSLNV